MTTPTATPSGLSERVREFMRRYEATADFGTVNAQLSADDCYALCKAFLSASAGRNEIIEECAVKCDSGATAYFKGSPERMALELAALHIRALKNAAPQALSSTERSVQEQPKRGPAVSASTDKHDVVADLVRLAEDHNYSDEFIGNVVRANVSELKAAQSASAASEALRPFAKYHELYLADDHATDDKLVFSHLTLGDFRRAASTTKDKA